MRCWPGIAMVSVVLLVLQGDLATGQEGIPSEGRSRAPGRSFADLLPISFEREWIRLHVTGDTLEVRGTYWLRCREHSDRSLALFYPFPRDSLLGGARMVSLRARLDGAEPVPRRWEEVPGADGVRLQLPACSGDTLEVEAVYRQAITPGYARYIVTTTRAWGRPLRHARFDLRLPPGIEPTECSYPFSASEDGSGGPRVYRYEAVDFFPDRDIVVRWNP